MAASKRKTSGAARLIQAANAKLTRKALPPEARAEIEEIATYNARVSRNQRVTADQVLRMLEDDYGLQCSRSTLDHMCRAAFGAPFGAMGGEER